MSEYSSSVSGPVRIGINGFGRIGKCIFLQLINNNKNIHVAAINAPNIDINYIESYLKHDSIHSYDKTWNVEIIDSNHFKIGNHKIRLFKTTDATQLDWKKYCIHYVIDATGSYLTTIKAKEHNVDYVILCAPPKDQTPQFVNNVNLEKYNGEHIVSNASCTTNCITPVLNFLENNYGIKNANFTTIHSTTSSQTTVDNSNLSNRIHRSIFNNIIPHSTGASNSIFELIPSLTGKVFGTSLRVPVSNVSIVDLNVDLEKTVTLKTLLQQLKHHQFIQVNDTNAVSCDFITTTCPSIVDEKASMHLGDNRFKLMIWYDNEWSYSAQVIRLLEKMITFNQDKHKDINIVDTKKYHIDNFNFNGKKVVLRLDWNIPTKNFKITDDFRITSSLQTIKRILNDNPERIIIISHFGRPNGKDVTYSWSHYLQQLQSYDGLHDIILLEDGLSNETLDQLQTHKDTHKVFLLENIRFHDVETNYTKYPDDNLERTVFQKLGDFYVNDAFGCCHRDHLSICGMNTPQKAFGYLIDKEVESLKLIIENKNNDKILAIIGGAKMDDKLPLIEALSHKMNDIYIGGGNINSIIKNNMSEYMSKINANMANIHLMKDGLCAPGLNEISTYCNVEHLPNNESFYDIGMQSLFELEKLIMQNDIIFVNGMLGVTEHKLYKHGSETLIHLLMNCGKKVIIAGGDSVGFTNQYNHNFFYVSTGGGSAIDYISNGSLVGIEHFGL